MSTPREPWHGSLSGYTNYVCRCPECTAAWREYSRQYMRDWRARQRLARGADHASAPYAPKRRRQPDG